jgi:hypothetical protein
VLNALKTRPNRIRLRRPNLSVRASLRHADVETLGDVEHEEWEQHGAADAVDKHHTDNGPEAGGKFFVGISQSGEHKILSLQKPNHSTSVLFLE